MLNWRTLKNNFKTLQDGNALEVNTSLLVSNHKLNRVENWTLADLYHCILDVHVHVNNLIITGTSDTKDNAYSGGNMVPPLPVFFGLSEN